MTDEQARDWCTPGGWKGAAFIPPGPADVMVPTPAATVVMCGAALRPPGFDGQSKPEKAYVVTDAALITPITDALNALDPKANVTCTQELGPSATAIFVNASGTPTSVTIGRFSCGFASNGTRDAPLGGKALAQLDALENVAGVRVVEVPASAS